MGSEITALRLTLSWNTKYKLLMFLRASKYNTESYTLLRIMNKVKLLKYDQSTTTEVKHRDQLFYLYFQL